MGNKVKYNLKNVHAAKLTRGEDGSFTYAKPKAIPGAVSISLDAEGDSSPFYADGIVYFRSTANNGYSGDLEIALIPEWFRTEILKEELDNNGVLIEKANITELEKFALEIFENVAYIMAYHADHSIPATIEDWLDEFEMFSIYEVLPEILELWGMNLQTEIESKKNFIAVAGK